MKIISYFSLITLAVMFFGASAFAQETRNSEKILLGADIDAATGHYKTVTGTIADKKMAAKITKDKTQLQELEGDLAILEKDKKATEEQIADLVAKLYAGPLLYN